MLTSSLRSTLSAPLKSPVNIREQVAAAVTYPADLVDLPLVWGWGTAQLAESEAGGIELQRASDDALATILYDTRGDLDEEAYLAHKAASTLTARTLVDQGAAGANAVQTTKASQPTVGKDGVSGRYYVRGDGVARTMATAPVDMTGATKATVILAIRREVRAGESIVWEHFNGSNSNLLIGSGYNGHTSVISGSLAAAGSYLQMRTPPLVDAASNDIVSFIFRPLAGTDALRCSIRINGEEVAVVRHGGAGTLSTACFVNAAIYLWSRLGGSYFDATPVFFTALYDDELTESELASWETWAARKYRTYVNRPSSFDDSRNVFTQSGNRRSASPYASCSFNTSATRFGVQTDCSYPDVGGQVFSVYINDDFYEEYTVSVPSGQGLTVIALPAGSKKVTFANGPTAWLLGGNIIGTYIQSIEANAALTRTTESGDGRLTVLGDSISVGSGASSFSEFGWTMRLRQYGAYPVSVEGYSYRSFYEECVDAAARSASVARILEHNPANLWIALGTNDYSRADWAPDAMQAGVAALLDDLNAALPSATIYVQTPLTRSGEANVNALGYNLAAYRTAIANATVGRAFCVLDDGSTVLTLADLDDGIHPNDSGHAKEFTRVKTRTGV